MCLIKLYSNWLNIMKLSRKAVAVNFRLIPQIIHRHTFIVCLLWIKEHMETVKPCYTQYTKNENVHIDMAVKSTNLKRAYQIRTKRTTIFADFVLLALFFYYTITLLVLLSVRWCCKSCPMTAISNDSGQKLTKTIHPNGHNNSSACIKWHNEIWYDIARLGWLNWCPAL